MKTGSLLKTLLTVIFHSTNISSFHFNFECSWPFQEVVLPVLLRLGVSKSPKIQAQVPWTSLIICSLCLSHCKISLTGSDKKTGS
jgi:hypothetical protein